MNSLLNRLKQPLKQRLTSLNRKKRRWLNYVDSPDLFIKKSLAFLRHQKIKLLRNETTPALFVYYNETLNDRWIVESVFPGKTNGYFLEAGAANGKEASSCYVLEKALGWTGICVEPNDAFFEKLLRNRPNSICEKTCLAKQAGKVSYIEGSDNTIAPYLGGIKRNLATVKYGGNEIIKKGKLVEKDAITLEQLLDKHRAPSIIDYASFDIEGSELEVLEDFPFRRYRFLAMSLECDGSIWKPITKLLRSNGYREVENPFNQDMPWERYWLHKSSYNSMECMHFFREKKRF